MADTTDVLEIPLEFGDFSAQNDENRPRPQKIAAHFEQMIHNPPPPAAAPALPERKASAEPNSRQPIISGLQQPCKRQRSAKFRLLLQPRPPVPD